MKKYLALALFVLMLCAFLTSAAPVLAEEAEPVVTESATATEQAPLPEAPAPEDETVTLPLPDVEVPKDVVTTVDEIVEGVKKWLSDNYEEIMVILYLSLALIYNIRRNKSLDKSVKTLNNNSVAVAEKSATSVAEASATVSGYTERMETLLAEYRSTAEEKRKLESTLSAAMHLIHTAKLANVELANEMAELLVLANIPNAKKEELYSRHRKAVDAIAVAELMEVKEDAVQEA